MLAKNQIFTIWYSSNMAANSFPEDTPSTLVKALLPGNFYQSKLLLVQEGLLSVSSVGMCMKYC